MTADERCPRCARPGKPRRHRARPPLPTVRRADRARPPATPTVHRMRATRPLVGVAIVGRPVASAYQDGRGVEVTRTATDGHPNANSMLYGAATRAAFAKGYRRVVTYTQEGESGASLRAAGWRVIAQRPPRKGWDTPSRPRADRGVDGIARTPWESTP